MYEYITKAFPSTTESSHANIMINMLPSDGAATAGKPAVAAAQPAASEQKEQPVDMDLSKLVHVVKPLADHPAASGTLSSNVQGWLKDLPKPVAELLAKNKIQIMVTPTLMDFRPDLAHTQGAGYDGATLKQCPGLYEPGERTLVLCERTISDTDDSISSPRSSDQINDTFYHELGHAIDFCLDYVSGSSEFQRVYRFDEANLHRGDERTERNMAYFLQKANRGPTEACGELIGVILGIKRNASETTAAFPNTITFLKQKLKLK
jgi:hypothetical protein